MLGIKLQNRMLLLKIEERVRDMFTEKSNVNLIAVKLRFCFRILPAYPLIRRADRILGPDHYLAAFEPLKPLELQRNTVNV